MKTASVSFHGAGHQTVKFEYPEYCPHCGKNISPEIIYVSDSEDSYSSGDARFVVTFRCSRSACKKYFAVEYIFTSRSELCSIAKYSYRPPIKVKLPENIEKVSPVFVEIYSQATVAEAEVLNQIAGVGYRKAAEFLIKDYAISKNKDDEEKIFLYAHRGGHAFVRGTSVLLAAGGTALLALADQRQSGPALFHRRWRQ